MSRQIIMDLTRLVYAGFCTAPTGIPRVELAYAEHFVADAPERTIFVVANALGRIVLLDRASALRFIARLKRFWSNGLGTRGARSRLFLATLRLHAGLLWRSSAALRRAIARYPGMSVYVLVSQLHLDRRGVMERLLAAGDVRLVCFVHDILPSVHPEWFPRGVGARKHRLLQQIARLADVIVVNSEETRRAFMRRFASDASRQPMIVAPLGVDVAPSRRRALPPAPHPYFVVVGTIEPRKNHLLLLRIWHELHTEFGSSAPHLVVIGSRGWKNADVVDLLDHSPALRGIVEEHAAASDEEVAVMLAGARALLFPAFAEGYGLPLAEALSLGVPAICSDIPAFREVGAGVPVFLDPRDAAAWRRAILEYAREPSVEREAQLARLRLWHAPSWAAHFVAVDAAIEALGAERRARV